MKKNKSKNEPPPKQKSFEVIAENRKARFDYFILDKYEAGICLAGHEVKSIRERQVNLKDSFVRVVRGEAFLLNCHISPYSKIQGYEELDPTRSRKLLLKKREIEQLQGRSGQKGFAVVTLRMYLKKGFVKVEIALGQGKKMHDKRESIKKRIHDRESASAIKRSSR